MSAGALVTITGRVMVRPAPQRTRSAQRYLRFRLAVDRSLTMSLPAELPPVVVHLYADQLDQLRAQLVPGAQVSLTGRLQVAGQSGDGTSSRTRLVLVATRCEVLELPQPEQGEVS